MTLQELANENGIVIDKRCTLTIEDLKHLGNYTDETHGQMIGYLQEFYDDFEEEFTYFFDELIDFSEQKLKILSSQD